MDVPDGWVLRKETERFVRDREAQAMVCIFEHEESGLLVLVSPGGDSEGYCHHVLIEHAAESQQREPITSRETYDPAKERAREFLAEFDERYDDEEGIRVVDTVYRIADDRSDLDIPSRV
jgi:hypothetical protein